MRVFFLTFALMTNTDNHSLKAEDLIDRFVKEYPQASQRLKKAFDNFQCSTKFKQVTFNRTQKHSMTEEMDIDCFVKQLNDMVIIQHHGAGRVVENGKSIKNKRHTGVICRTPSIAFVLYKTTKAGVYLVDTIIRTSDKNVLEDVAYLVDYRFKAALYSPFHIEYFDLAELLENDHISITEAKRIDNTSKIKYTFSFNEGKYEGPEFNHVGGYFVIDEELGWVIVESQLVRYFKEANKHAYATIKTKTKKVRNGDFTVPTQVEWKVDVENTNDRGDISTFAFSGYNFEEVSDEQFTLPAFGISDFRQVAESDSLFRSWIFWSFVALAIISSGGYFYYRKRAI